MLLDAPLARTLVHVDPHLGVLCVGVHGPSGRVRAVDAAAKRVLWEASASVTASPVGNAMSLADGRIYAADESTLFALDAYTGTPLWGVQLPEAVQTAYGRLSVADPYPRHYPGRVVVQTVNDNYVALDRMTGMVVWTVGGAQGYGPVATAGGVILGVRRDREQHLDFVDPVRGPYALCSLPSTFVLLRQYGGMVAVGAADIDGQANPGVALVDMPFGSLRFAATAPFDEKRGRPVVVGPYVWSLDALRFAGSPRGPSAGCDMIPGFLVQRLEGTAYTLVALLTESAGDGRQMLAGFDPNTMAPRFRTEPRFGLMPQLAEGMSNLAASGAYVAIAGRLPEKDGKAQVGLAVLYGDTGQLLWWTEVPGALESLEATGPYFRVRTTEQIAVFRPDVKEPLARLEHTV